MKIGIICNGLVKSGGMERYTLDLIREFHSRGVKIVVFTKKVDKSLEETAMVQVVKISATLLPKRIQDFYVSSRIPALRIKYPVDLLISCCRCDHSDVFICGGTHPGFLEATKKKKSWFDKAVLFFEKKIYERVPCVVAHSKLVSREVEHYFGVSSKRVEVIYPPVDLSLFKPSSCAQRLQDRQKIIEEFALDGSKTIFLFVSSSHKRKGFPLLEQFFENTDLPVTLLVCGRPLPKRQYKNIRYVGYVKEMEKFYNGVDFSILASSYEPFGLVAIESIAMGTPVVISKNLGANEVIQDTVKTVFDPVSLSSLSKAIENAIKNKKELSERALMGNDKKFTVNFALPQHVDSMFSLFRDKWNL